MDVVLHYFDEFVGDAVWAALLPASSSSSSSSSFSSSPSTSYGRPSSSWLSSQPSSPSSQNFPTTAASPSSWTSHLPRDSIIRQSISLYVITYVGILLLYFTFASLSYRFIFDKRMEQHPRFLKNQKSLEIQSSLQAFPTLDLLTLPWFVGEVRGWSKLYEKVEDGPLGGGVWGWVYMAVSAGFFLWFTDFFIYLVHRAEHHPSVYKWLHKPHHKWIIPTPYASHAFHPLDGYAQSLPYHVFAYIFPLHKFQYMGLFVFVNFWSILIHDSDMIVDHPLEKVINGPAHHTLHHLYFTCNYGQYFTWADRAGGSYRHPAKGDDPLMAVLEARAAKAQQQAASAEDHVAPSPESAQEAEVEAILLKGQPEATATATATATLTATTTTTALEQLDVKGGAGAALRLSSRSSSMDGTASTLSSSSSSSNSSSDDDEGGLLNASSSAAKVGKAVKREVEVLVSKEGIKLE